MHLKTFRWLGWSILSEVRDTWKNDLILRQFYLLCANINFIFCKCCNFSVDVPQVLLSRKKRPNFHIFKHFSFCEKINFGVYPYKPRMHVLTRLWPLDEIVIISVRVIVLLCTSIMSITSKVFKINKQPLSIAHERSLINTWAQCLLKIFKAGLFSEIRNVIQKVLRLLKCM